MVEVEREDCVSVSANGVLGHGVSVDHDIGDYRVKKALIEQYLELARGLLVTVRLWKVGTGTDAQVGAAPQARPTSNVWVVLRIGVVVEAEFLAHVIYVGIRLLGEVALPQVSGDVEVGGIEPVEKFADHLDFALLCRRAAVDDLCAQISVRDVACVTGHLVVNGKRRNGTRAKHRTGDKNAGRDQCRSQRVRRDTGGFKESLSPFDCAVHRFYSSRSAGTRRRDGFIVCGAGEQGG
jgi:hypothetical protein